jgi:hypothetical protein
MGGSTPRDAAGWMWDLTIPGDHDFYIQATTDTAILVHNCSAAQSSASFEGGRYGDLKTGNGIELHHMPADSVSPLLRSDGPAIQMERPDHYQTASWGRSAEASTYRAQQQALINGGQFDDAIQMDINDVTSKFPGKYDDASSR